MIAVALEAQVDKFFLVSCGHIMKSYESLSLALIDRDWLRILSDDDAYVVEVGEAHIVE